MLKITQPIISRGWEKNYEIKCVKYLTRCIKLIYKQDYLLNEFWVFINPDKLKIFLFNVTEIGFTNCFLFNACINFGNCTRKSENDKLMCNEIFKIKQTERE